MISEEISIDVVNDAPSVTWYRELLILTGCRARLKIVIYAPKKRTEKPRWHHQAHVFVWKDEWVEITSLPISSIRAPFGAKEEADFRADRDELLRIAREVLDDT